MTGPYKNLFAHEPHGLWQVVQWKLGWRGFRPRRPRPAFLPEEMEGPAEGAELSVALPEKEALQCTWIGHASFLLQGAGLNLLVDPVFSKYCFPLPWRRLRRLQPPGLAYENLPPIDGVLITHSHFDHLDRATVRRLGPRVSYFVPAGLGAWFHRLGMRRVQEFGWWESASVASGLRLHGLPAQHFSARTWRDRNRSLWCGWLIELGDRRIYVAGDTGYCPVFRDIGKRFGPMDLSILPIGAYEPRWLMKTMHVSPEESVQIHQDVRSRLSVASHWGTFDLTDEPVWEPPVRLGTALSQAGVAKESFRVMRIGQTLRVSP